MTQARSYCFTINNPTETPDQVFNALPAFNYCVFQLESGERDTRHYQGYVNFKSTVRFTTLSNALPRAHLEIAKGSAAQNRTYCTKAGRLEGPWERGNLPTQGKRSDLERATEIMKNGGRKRLLEEMPQMFFKYPKGIDALELEFAKPEEGLIERKVHLLYGPSRTGKSFKARQAGNADYFVLCDAKWFDRYNGQSTVILDDYGAGWKITIPQILRMTDNYQDITVQVKGGHRWWTAETIIFTSNLIPREWHKWEGKESQREALAKRFDSVLIMKERDGDHLQLTDPIDILHFFSCDQYGMPPEWLT